MSKLSRLGVAQQLIGCIFDHVPSIRMVNFCKAGETERRKCLISKRRGATKKNKKHLRSPALAWGKSPSPLPVQPPRGHFKPVSPFSRLVPHAEQLLHLLEFDRQLFMDDCSTAPVSQLLATNCTLSPVPGHHPSESF